MPAESLTWVDSDGIGTLSNGKPIPGTRFGNWTPDVAIIGPSKTRLGSGRVDVFEFRTDDLVSFEIAAIPGTPANLRLCKRLKKHLLRGGVVVLTTTRPTADDFEAYSLAEGTTPAIDFSDRDNLEYTFSVTLKGLDDVDPDEFFYPAVIPGLLLWLVGDSLLEDLTDASLVPQWTDISGEDNHAVQADSGKMPLFRPGVANGHSALEFAGNNFVRTPEIMQPTLGSSVFVVMRRTPEEGWVSNGAYFCWGQPSAGNGDEGASVQEWPAGTLGFFSAVGVPDNVAPLEDTPSDPLDWHIVTLKFDTISSCTPYVDGVEGTPFDPNSSIEGSNLSTFIVGASNGSGIYYGANCQVAEVIWYDSALSEGNRDSVHAYLASLYGITLPA